MDWISDLTEDKEGAAIDLSEVGMSEARKEERRKLIGASDMPIIMGDSPYKTPIQLWEDKTHRVPISNETNFAIERGIRWEDRVRKLFEERTNMKFVSKNFTHPDNPIHSASLDGYNAQFAEGLEIKVTSDKNLQLVKAGKVPELYWAQVQWQIYVANLSKNNFFCVKVDTNEEGEEEIVDTALTVVRRHDKYIEELKAKAEQFWNYVETDTRPPLSDMDVKELKTPEARKDFSELKYIKQKLDDKKQELKEFDKVYRQVLRQCLQHCDHAITECDGIRVKKVVKKGSVDISKMSPEQLEEYEKFRKEDTTSYRVTLLKDGI